MNTIIIYSSKYGTTADCAKYLESGLTGSKLLVDIGKTNPHTIDLNKFDTIVIGSSIYIGAVSKKIRSLCKEHSDLLLEKRVGIFLCCAFFEQTQEYLSANFSAELLKNAVVTKSFGGEARLAKMTAVDKLIMKAATKGSDKNLNISQENMDVFIKELTSKNCYSH